MASYLIPDWISTIKVHENSQNLEEIFRTGQLRPVEDLSREYSGRIPAEAARRLWLALLHIAAAAHAEGRIIGEIPTSAIWMQIAPEGRVCCLKSVEEFSPPPPPEKSADYEKLGPPVTPEAQGPSSDLFNIATFIFGLLVGRERLGNDTEMFRALSRIRFLREDLPEELILLLFRHLEEDPQQRPLDAADEIELFSPIEDELLPTTFNSIKPFTMIDSNAGAVKRRAAARGPLYPNQPEINQDAYLKRYLGDNLFLIGVFDGVSTCTLGNGGQAAEIAREIFEEQGFDSAALAQIESDAKRLAFVKNWLAKTLAEANIKIAVETRSLYSQNREDEQAVDTTHPMLTTATVAIVLGNRFVLGWLGDSPAFLLDKHSCAPLNYPHDTITEMLSLGRTITETFATEPESGITKYLGGVVLSEDVDELEDEITVEVHVPSFIEGTLTGGTILMIASDGILDQTSKVPFVTLLKRFFAEAAAASRGDAEQQVEELFELLWTGANHKTQRDNITLILFHGKPVANGDRLSKAPKK
jgi:serine/threonine protein phosphatase PrpC